MIREKKKRIYAGYYQRYDGKIIYVVMVLKDIDTGEEMVVFQPYKHNSLGKHAIMSKRSFCEIVDFDGSQLPKFKRRTQHVIDPFMNEYQEAEGFRGPIHHNIGKKSDCEIRQYQRCSTYLEYSKDIISNYSEDLRKYELCIQQKKYVGVFPDQFPLLQEDLKYLKDCTDTVLIEYRMLLNEKFLKQLSIRKYAKHLGVNRGSVEYMQKKFFQAFAEQLRIRDETEQKCRLR